jgi:hypothetical protein
LKNLRRSGAVEIHVIGEILANFAQKPPHSCHLSWLYSAAPLNADQVLSAARKYPRRSLNSFKMVKAQQCPYVNFGPQWPETVD